MSPGERARALADPRVVRREEVVPLAPRHERGLRGFVVEVERLVTGEELDAGELGERALAEGGHEAQRLGERARLRLVLCADVGRHGLLEAEVPVFGVRHVGEPRGDERADEVDGETGVLVGRDHSRGIWPSGLGRERGRVDRVAEVARERHPLARLGLLAAGLGVLPRDATHPNDRRLGRMDEHERHLQEDLQLARDDVARAVRQRLGAVAALEHEPPSQLGIGDLLAEALDLP